MTEAELNVAFAAAAADIGVKLTAAGLADETTEWNKIITIAGCIDLAGLIPLLYPNLPYQYQKEKVLDLAVALNTATIARLTIPAAP